MAPNFHSLQCNLNHRKVRQSENPTNISILEKKPWVQCLQGNFPRIAIEWYAHHSRSRRCLIVSRWVIWTWHGTRPRCMPRSLHCQNQRQVKHRWEAWSSGGNFCSFVCTAHITTTVAWVQTYFLFVLMPPNVVSWLLFVLMCCRHMSPYLWLGVPSSMSYWTWALRSWLSVWALLIWCMRCFHENVVVCTTRNRCEVLPQKYYVSAIKAHPSELTLVCCWRVKPWGVCW